MSLKLNVSYNKTTKKFVGYSSPKNGRSLVVEAYAMDDLEKKFEKAEKQFLDDEKRLKDATIKELGRLLRDSDDVYGGSLS